jgi:hypothetical protein
MLSSPSIFGAFLRLKSSEDESVGNKFDDYSSLSNLLVIINWKKKKKKLSRE